MPEFEVTMKFRVKVEDGDTAMNNPIRVADSLMALARHGTIKDAMSEAGLELRKATHVDCSGPYANTAYTIDPKKLKWETLDMATALHYCMEGHRAIGHGEDHHYFLRAENTPVLHEFLGKPLDKVLQANENDELYHAHVSRENLGINGKGLSDEEIDAAVNVFENTIEGLGLKGYIWNPGNQEIIQF